MKRKILNSVVAFRIWDAVDKKFEDELDYAVRGDGVILYNWDHDEWSTHLNHTMFVSRFTGFRDVNDADIYEGDIVMCGAVVKEITYISGCFMLGEYALREVDLLGGCMKVIGNVFENPELLNK